MKILSTLLLATTLCGISSLAQAQVPKSQITTTINTDVYANGRGAITGVIMNSLLNLMNTSYGALVDTNIWTGINTFSGPGVTAPITISGGISGISNASIITGGTAPLNIQTGSSIFLGQSTFNMLSLTTTDLSIVAKSGNVIIGPGSAIATTNTIGFVSIPFMNGTPTGTPTYLSEPSCVWNDSSFSLNCYSPGAAAWKHVTLSAGAG